MQLCDKERVIRWQGDLWCFTQFKKVVLSQSVFFVFSPISAFV